MFAVAWWIPVAIVVLWVSGAAFGLMLCAAGVVAERAAADLFDEEDEDEEDE